MLEYSQQTTDLISPHEYILALIYLLMIYAFAYVVKARYYRKSPLKKYFIPALSVKLIGAIGVTLIYNYYYKGGDTSNYFFNSKIIASVFFRHPGDGIRLLLSKGGDFAPDLMKYVGTMEYALAESSYMIVKISAFIQLFTFQSFLVTAIFFGFFSFWAIWKIFTVFCGYYPELKKEFAICFLFVPSVFFWGSGILKDTVSLAALAIFFSCIDGFFFKGKNKILNGIGIFLAGYILAMVKVYIIMSFSICVVILIFLNYRMKIRSKSLRLFITPIVIFGSVVLGLVIMRVISETSSRYTLDNLLETSEVTREYIYTTGGGSSYSLGEIDNSVWGLIKVFPAGVNVTLFRPYLWEAHNFIALIAALESLAIFLLTVIVFFKTGPVTFFKTILSKNLIFFCLMFSVIFAFSVGISSYNFGSLVRYKIPCIPFYIAGIQIIGYLSRKKLEERRKRARAAALNMRSA